MRQEFRFATPLRPYFGGHAFRLRGCGEVRVQAGQQLAGGFLPRIQQAGRYLFRLREQEGTPIQAHQVIGAAGNHLPGDGEHARTVAQRLPGGEIQFLPHLLQFSFRVLGLPLVEQCQALLGRRFGPNGEHQIVLVAVGPFGGDGARGRLHLAHENGQAGSDCAQRPEVAGGLHGFFTVITLLESAVTSTSWRFTILPSCMVRISYLPTGTRTVAGTCGATCLPSNTMGVSPCEP
jgi:hypothetical protein